MNIYRQNEYVPELPIVITFPKPPRRRASFKHALILAGAFGVIGAMGGGTTACGGALTEQGLTTVEATSMCITSIILDVTGLATEDPIQIAEQCQVAVIDIYNFVQAELALSSQVGDAGADGAPTLTPAVSQITITTARKGTIVVKRLAYITSGQVARLNRIGAAAQKSAAAQ